MNELLLGAEAAVSTLFIVLAWGYARERLFGVIALFLILIANLGGKVVVFFGHTTNTGNIFYAALYLATYFIIERLGRRQGIRAIWLAVIAVAFFYTFVQITVALSGDSATAQLNSALAIAYAPFSQVTLASLIAYVLSQNLNVYLYAYLKEHLHGSKLWIRANICNVLSQIVDSAIFFTIAFWGVVAPANIADIIMTGFIIKVAYVAIASPLLYLNRIEQEDGKDYVTISLR